MRPRASRLRASATKDAAAACLSARPIVRKAMTTMQNAMTPIAVQMGSDLEPVPLRMAGKYARSRVFPRFEGAQRLVVNRGSVFVCGCAPAGQDAAPINYQALRAL